MTLNLNNDSQIQEPVENDIDLDQLALASSLVSATLIASLIVTQSGWVLQQRTYPRLPITDNLSIANGLEPLLFGVMVTSLLAFMFHARKKLWTLIFTLAAAAAVALDQTRLQPWLYLFSIMLFLCASFRQSVQSNNAGSLLNALRICILGTYLYAGAQKLNISFCTTVVPSMFKHIIQEMPQSLDFAIGIPLALSEAGLAILLIFPRTSTIGAYLAIFFHAVTLWLITQQGWNSAVWPWNIAMVLLVYLLFIRARVGGIVGCLKPDSPQKVTAILLFLLLPALNFFGLWDNYLSAALYSGNVPVLRIEVSPEDEQALPVAMRQAINITDTERPILFAERWALEELNIPAYPETRSLERLAEKVRASGRLNHSRFYLETFPRFFKGENRRKALFLSATESR